MPGPARSYATNADRQRAYRERCRTTAQSTSPPPRSLSPPGTAARPGRSRWRGLLRQASSLLHTAHEERESYYAQRPQSWRDGEGGECFLERIQALQDPLDAVTEVEL